MIASSSAVLRSGLQTVLKIQTKFNSTKFATREFEEIKFDVPWGHVAGKWYGPKNTRPIVGFHGWQDNAGTFDTLAPLLSPHVGFLAIDLPGHGYSSWLPNGFGYHSLDYVKFVNTLMKHYGWDKISMICHSMSSSNAFIFASLYPDKCDMIVGFDFVKPFLMPGNMVLDDIAKQITSDQKLSEINNMKTDPPCYDFDFLIEKLYEASGKSVDKECCQFILKRNIKPSEKEPNKYYFSRDGRLKALIFSYFPHETCVEMAKRIKCPHLFIKAKQSATEDYLTMDYDEIIGLLSKKPTFEYHLIDGTHHVHLNEPQKIANIINPFIKKYRPE